MKKKTFFVVSVMAFLMVSIFLATNVLAEEITIRGKVNEKYQIVSEDGQIYEVAENEKGDEVVLQNIGKIVKISGTIEESDEGDKIITVILYEVEAEAEAEE
jgi:peptidoglycan hydrolase CwlO-like protein